MMLVKFNFSANVEHKFSEDVVEIINEGHEVRRAKPGN